MIYNLKQSTLDAIITQCVSFFGVEFDELCARDRTEPLASIRAICIVVMREKGLTYSKAAASLGRNHQVARYHCNNHDGRMETDRNYRDSYNAFKAWQKELNYDN